MIRYRKWFTLNLDIQKTTCSILLQRTWNNLIKYVQYCYWSGWELAKLFLTHEWRLWPWARTQVALQVVKQTQQAKLGSFKSVHLDQYVQSSVQWNYFVFVSLPQSCAWMTAAFWRGGATSRRVCTSWCVLWGRCPLCTHSAWLRIASVSTSLTTVPVLWFRPEFIITAALHSDLTRQAMLHQHKHFYALCFEMFIANWFLINSTCTLWLLFAYVVQW